jgi:hypothetical protein
LADYRFASTISGVGSNTTYRPSIGTSGLYDVFIWYPQGSNRATNAPWSVVYTGGTTNVFVDQSINGGGWRLIAGARPFQSGTNGYAQLSNDTGYSGKVVMADGVRFKYVGPIPVAPIIVTQPTNQSAKVGTNVTFTVSASGTPAPAYQWRFNDSPIIGETNSSYTRFNIQTNDAGNYSVLVTNLAGSAISSNATLTVTLSLPWQFQSVGLLPDGRVRLVITGETGASAWLERGTNFASWSAITNFVNAIGTFEFIDSDVTNLSQGIYRVRR